LRYGGSGAKALHSKGGTFRRNVLQILAGSETGAPREIEDDDECEDEED